MYRKNQVLGRFCPAQHPDSRFILFCNCLIFSIMQSENSLKLCSPFWYGWFLCHFYIIFKTLHKSSANNLFFISIWTNLSLASYVVVAY